jgi:hypothetical protein
MLRGGPDQIRAAFNFLGAAGMSTVARDLDYVLVIRVPAMIAAVFIVSRYRAAATAMCTPAIIFICHSFYSPLFENFASPQSQPHCAR